MALTLGGDGTILRAARMAAPLGIPLLGLNLGRVGFLTECEPEHWVEVVERILANEGSVEERMMLQVTHLREGVMQAREFALNDAVISRAALARTVHLLTAIDGAVLTEYVADALILATATGSTAYSYAVGGPILPPWLDNIVVAPVAAHLSLDRPLVLNAEGGIRDHCAGNNARHGHGGWTTHGRTARRRLRAGRTQPHQSAFPAVAQSRRFLWHPGHPP